MTDIHYTALNDENFGEHSLDGFIRLQTMKEAWLPDEDGWKLTPLDSAIIWDWDLEKRREMARTIVDGIHSGGFGFGAFHEGKIIGYIFITGEFWGSQQQYTELKLYHISAPYRRMGIGRELFRLGTAQARAIGARKLYISANNSRESQEAYRKLGCVYAEEINRECVEREPFDVQMEYCL